MIYTFFNLNSKDVIDGEQKIVAGMVYRMRFNMAETSCDKSLLKPEIAENQSLIIKNCQLTAQTPIECSITFQYMPWLHEVELMNTEGSDECFINL